jgi:LemA protein
MDAPVVLLIALAAIVLIPSIYLINVYNRLVRLRTLVRNSWSNIDAELKRRHDLIPNLVAVVKGYAAHERDVLERVIQARQQAMRLDTPTHQHAEDESELARTARGLVALAEGYPELKANRNFLELQEELGRTEDRIAAARRFYNGNVKDLNTLVEQFPSNLVAGAMGFQAADSFEVETIFEHRPVAVDLEGTL